jgi:tetratricopeptide (TPR) repeat protein
VNSGRLKHLEAALTGNDFCTACDILQKHDLENSSTGNLVALIPFWNHIPTLEYSTNFQFVRFSCQLLIRTEHIDLLEQLIGDTISEFSGQEQACLHLEMAYVLLYQQLWSDAAILLEKVLDKLNGIDQLLCYRRLMWANSCLGENWQATFKNAQMTIQNLSKTLPVDQILYQKGLLFKDAGTCFNSDQASREAQYHWDQALRYFINHPLQTAQTHTLMAHAYLLVSNLSEAFHHFTRAEQLTLGDTAFETRTSALVGLAGLLRTRGDKRRAKQKYTNAFDNITKYVSSYDHAMVYWGYTRFLRLCNDSSSIEIIGAAVKVLPQAYEIQREQIAAHLQFGQFVQAQEQLSQLKRQDGTNFDLQRICHAEIARLEQNPVKTLEWLQGLDWSSRLVREEIRCFPALFAQATELDLPVPEPLPWSDELRVEFFVCGTPVLVVNGDRQEVRHPSQALVLLFALLEAPHNQLSTEKAISLVIQDAAKKKPRDVQKRISSIARDLRDLLGCDKALETNAGYCLDPIVKWWSQLWDIRANQTECLEFMVGYEDYAWISDVGHGILPSM